MTNWKAQLALGCVGVVLGIVAFALGHGEQLYVFLGCFLLLSGATGIALAVYVRRQGHR